MSNFDYFDFRIKFITEKINDEINFYEKSEYITVYPFNEYLSYLKNRVGLNKYEINAMFRYDVSGNKCEIKKMNMNEYTKDIDIYVYKRPWNKLREFHKIVKIKEFIDNIKFSSKINQSDILKNKEKLKQELCDGIREKKFKKNKNEIIYDKDEMKITSITCLIFNKKKRLYDVIWKN